MPVSAYTVYRACLWSQESIQLVCERRLFSMIEAQTRAMLRGLHHIIPKDVLAQLSEMVRRRWLASRHRRRRSILYRAAHSHSHEICGAGQVTPAEFSQLVAGRGFIDVDDWERNAAYAGGLSAADAVVQWFWQSIRAFSDVERHAAFFFPRSAPPRVPFVPSRPRSVPGPPPVGSVGLQRTALARALYISYCLDHCRQSVLQFVTGSCRVPVGGFAHLQGFNGGLHRFTLAGVRGWAKGTLPTAHACICTMDLSADAYASYDDLERCLRVAATLGSVGFDDAGAAQMANDDPDGVN